MPSQFEQNLDKYAKLIVHAGCALQEGQILYIGADLTQVDLVRRITREAYESGACEVIVRWSDEVTSRMNYEYRPLEAFQSFPDWQALLQNGVAKQGAALLFIESQDPELFTGIDHRKLAAWQKAATEACPDWRNGMDFGRNVWCIVGGASPAWAARVFPDLPEDEAVSKLWDAIFTTVRVDTPDPIAAWQTHDESFAERVAWLNEQHFDELRYSNSLGTDMRVGLLPKGIWEGGSEVTVSGTRFFPNMPTEEIFTSPDRMRTNGTVHSALPLNYNGALIDNFTITFKDGRVTDFTAEKGYGVLKSIIDTDEGAHFLGEVSLIPCTSPIRKTGILFLSTLFDENASCHYALGIGFPECYEGGLDMSKEELLAAGINDSVTHVDFMLGTEDLSIDGIRADGTVVPVFRNGVWAS